MKTSNDSPENWAASTLDIENNGSVKSSLLKYVENSGFILNDFEIHALDVLAKKSTGEDSEYFQNHCSSAIMKEVDHFRSSYFKYSPEERNKKYKDLNEKSEKFADCKAALTELRKGLTINVKALPEKSELIPKVLKIYSTPPRERAVLLDELNQLPDKEKKSLYKEFKNLNTIHNSLSSLLPELEDILNVEPLVKVERTPKKEKGPVNYWVIVFAVYIIFKLILLLGRSSTPTSTPVNTPPIDKEKVDEFLKYLEESKKKNQSKSGEANE